MTCDEYLVWRHEMTESVSYFLSRIMLFFFLVKVIAFQFSSVRAKIIDLTKLKKVALNSLHFLVNKL